jgi:hypothetical protein
VANAKSDKSTRMQVRSAAVLRRLRRHGASLLVPMAVNVPVQGAAVRAVLDCRPKQSSNEHNGALETVAIRRRAVVRSKAYGKCASWLTTATVDERLVTGRLRTAILLT